MAIELSSTVCWSNPSPLGAQVDDHYVLMNTEAGFYYGFDATASAIWRRIEHPVVVADLCAKCAADYDGDAAIIEADIMRVLETLAEHRLITVS